MKWNAPAAPVPNACVYVVLAIGSTPARARRRDDAGWRRRLLRLADDGALACRLIQARVVVGQLVRSCCVRARAPRTHAKKHTHTHTHLATAASCA